MIDNTPTELTTDDIDKFIQEIDMGKFDIKIRECMKCGNEHLPNYGYGMMECDPCFFSRFPKEQVEEFCRSFFE